MNKKPQQKKSASGKRIAVRAKTPTKRLMREKDLDINLNPGLRDRLVTEMDGARILPDERLKYLCMITGTAPQTARRWINSDKPGLPDLFSFALLCTRFDSDANWLLGLTQTRFTLPKIQDTHSEHLDILGNKREWVDYVVRQVSQDDAECEIIRMQGDDMEPKIPDGAPLLVDFRITEITTNGTYLLRYQGRVMVRRVEIRIGEGWILSCENQKYKPTLIKGTAAAKKIELTVIGRVKFCICVEKF